MITEDRGLSMLKGANLVPQLDQIDVDVEAAAYLATLEQRSSEMTQLDTKPTETNKPLQRRLVLVLGTGVAAVLIGAVLVLTQNSESPSAITQIPPTTVAAVETPTTVEAFVDPLVEEGLATAFAFVEALVAGDLVSANDLALDSVKLDLIRVNNASSGDLGVFPWMEAVGWESVLEECIISSPDPVNTGITCAVSHTTSVSRAIGVEPITTSHRFTVMHPGGTYFGQSIDATMIVDDGTLGDAVPNASANAEFRTKVFDPFIRWLEDNHRDDLEQVMLHAFELGPQGIDVPTGVYFPDHAPESVALWQQYSEEYIAQLDN